MNLELEAPRVKDPFVHLVKWLFIKAFEKKI